MFFPIILGTSREGRQSEKVAEYVAEQAAAAKHSAQILDTREFAPIATDNTVGSAKAKKLAEIVKKADGLIIVSPEYNHGYPGELKLMLDLLYKEYSGKPVAIIGVSAGGLGGVRMVEQLRLVCIELGLAPLKGAVYFSGVGGLSSAKGMVVDSSYSGRVLKLLEELAARARVAAK